MAAADFVPLAGYTTLHVLAGGTKPLSQRTLGVSCSSVLAQHCREQLQREMSVSATAQKSAFHSRRVFQQRAIIVNTRFSQPSAGISRRRRRSPPRVSQPLASRSRVRQVFNVALSLHKLAARLLEQTARPACVGIGGFLTCRPAWPLAPTKSAESKVSQEATGKWHAPNSRVQRTPTRSPVSSKSYTSTRRVGAADPQNVRRLVLARTRPTILEALSAMTRCPQRKVCVPFTARFSRAYKPREHTFLEPSAGISRRSRR